jgi:hypothetical protein
MIDLWELICHHTYRGIPGVVVDLSGTDASHGRAWGLADADFLADGATAGSGAVRCYAPSGRVHVNATAKQWQLVNGIRGEVTLRREPGMLAFIIDSDSFQFHIRGDALIAWFSSYPSQYAEISTAFDSIDSPAYRVPTGRWITLGFMHDGFGTMELYADGAAVARRHSALAPVNAPGAGGIGIGNAVGSILPLNGQIDEVKLWRLNPRRFEEAFNNRPMDAETRDCWSRFLREFVEALRRHPECAGKIGPAIDNVLRSILRQIAAQGAETKARLLKAASEYAALWRAGNVSGPEMAKVFADLIAWLQLAGIPIETNPAVAQLADSECLKKILGEITRPDCDRQAMELLASIVKALGKGDAPGPQ